MKPSKSSLVQAMRAANQEKVSHGHQHSGKPDSQNTSNQDDQNDEEEFLVNLCIKVSKRQRLHWLIEAKQHGTSLTEGIITALDARFGSPFNEATPAYQNASKQDFYKPDLKMNRDPS